MRQLVLREVLKHDQATVSQVLAAVGKSISASKAAAVGRRIRSGKSSGRVSVVDLGKKHMVNHALCELLRAGKIRRVGKGVYAPPLPRLFKTA